MRRFMRLFTLWLWGGFLYTAIELLWRGYTHPSMYAVGGICFLIVGGINNVLPWAMGLISQSFIGAAAVTVVEFVSGCILNLWLGLGIWDYSGVPLNFLGQICLPYCAAWVFLSAVGIVVDDYLRWLLYDEQRPVYKIF